MIYFLDNSLQLQKIVTSKNVISAIHEHELNGLIRADVELDLSYANKFLILGIDHVGYYYNDDFYLHKIQRVEYDHVNESAKVVLRHIFFEDMIFGKLIRDVRPQNQDALTVSRQTIDANTRWQTIMTDVTGRLSTNFYWQVPYEVIEFMTENYRIEYLPKILFDGQNINGFQLHLANKIGEDKNIRIPYGSRVLDLKYEEDYSEIITKLVVHGKGEEVGDGYGRRINISDVNFNRNGVESPAGSLYLEDESITNTYGNDGQTPREGREVFEDIEDANELAEAGYQHYLQVSRPQMLFTADVADIGDVGIGDSVMIIRREYDVYFNARIHKLSVDLLYPEDARVELGDYKHFKESKVKRKARERDKQFKRETSDQIQRLKEEFDDRFDGETDQMWEEYEQALIDVHAEIEAAEQRHEDRWQEIDDDINRNIEKIVGGNVDILDTNLLDINQRMLSKLEESDLDPFENRLTVNEEGIDGLLTRTSEAEQLIADINLSVDGITADFASYKRDVDSDVGALSSQVASYEASVDGFRAEVGSLQGDINNVDSWIADKGSIIDGNADAISARVWQKDIDDLEIGGRNLISKSDVVEHIDEWKGFGTSNITLSSNENLVGYLWIYRNDVTARDHVGAESPSLIENVIEGRSYTIRFKATHFRDTDPNMVYMYLMNDTPNSNNQAFGSVDVKKRVFSSNIYSDEWIYEISFVPNFSGPAHMLFGTRAVNSRNQASFYIKEPMLVEGTHVQGDWSPAPDDFLKHTDFILESDGFFLGGKYVGGDHYSTAIVGSANGVDILADEMRVTGDLLVKGDVESYAISAVRADFQSATANYFSANILKSDWIDVDNAIVNRIISRQFFTDNAVIKAANIRDLTAIDIKGGILSSLNGNYTQNLNTGITDYYGNALIHFHDENNRLRMTHQGHIMEIGTKRGATSPIFYMGGHRNLTGQVEPNDYGFTGLKTISDINRAEVIGDRVYIAEGGQQNAMAVSFDYSTALSNRTGYIMPIRRDSGDSYYIGDMNTWFDGVYTHRLSGLDIYRNPTSHNVEIGRSLSSYPTSAPRWSFRSDDIWYKDGGGSISVKERLAYAKSAYDRVFVGNNSVEEQIRSLAGRIYALERK